MTLANNPQQVVASDLSDGKFYRALYSNRQLQEELVDFWYNHFNVFLDKGADRFLVPSYERDAIRPHVLGKFRDLLEATANSPAMMFYLDNWQSVAPGDVRRPNGKKPTRGLNENYARELMELHTLGVDGGYTQKDIIEVARCFTGWTLRPAQGAGFEYNDRVHDKGEKMVLGVTIPAGGGKEDGEKVLDILAAHPSTARFISKELAQRFVADDPPPALVDRMAQTFLSTGGDIQAVMATMLSSKEFFSEGAYHAKVKTPFEMMVSALRATGAQVDSVFQLSQQIVTIGGASLPQAGTHRIFQRQCGMGKFIGLAGSHELRAFAQPESCCGCEDGHEEVLQGPPDEVARQLLFTSPTKQTAGNSWQRSGSGEKEESQSLSQCVDGGPGIRFPGLSKKVGSTYDQSKNISKRLGSGDGGNGHSAGVALARAVRGRCAEPSQEGAGGGVPAWRGGWLECGGPVRRASLLRLAAEPRDPEAGRHSGFRHRPERFLRPAPRACSA